MPPLVLPVSPGAPGNRRFCSALAGSETVCISSGQADTCGSLQSEGMRDQTPRSGHPRRGSYSSLPWWSKPCGRFLSGQTCFSIPGQDFTPSSQDLKALGLANHWQPVIAPDLKHVEDLQALYVSEQCMEFDLGFVKCFCKPGLVTSPKSCPHHFIPKWLCFMPSVLLPLLLLQRKCFIYFALLAGME